MAPQGMPGRSGLGTYIAERTIATQGPWLVVLILLGIVLTCGDRRATVIPVDQLCLPHPHRARSLTCDLMALLLAGTFSVHLPSSQGVWDDGEG